MERDGHLIMCSAPTDRQISEVTQNMMLQKNKSHKTFHYFILVLVHANFLSSLYKQNGRNTVRVKAMSTVSSHCSSASLDTQPLWHFLGEPVVGIGIKTCSLLQATNVKQQLCVCVLDQHTITKCYWCVDGMMTFH